LYEQFMNYRLGFTKTAAEYTSFMSQCGTHLFNISCDTLQSITAGCHRAVPYRDLYFINCALSL
jgi:hypothetical protein